MSKGFREISKEKLDDLTEKLGKLGRGEEVEKREQEGQTDEQLLSTLDGIVIGNEEANSYSRGNEKPLDMEYTAGYLENE